MQRSLMAAVCSFSPSEHPFQCLLSLLQTGDRLTGGDIFGLVHENTLIDHKIMVQPGAQGTVSWIAPQGEYTLTDKVLELEFAGNKKVSGWLAWLWSACKGLEVASVLASAQGVAGRGQKTQVHPTA